jgi:hypothetical protein
MLWILEMDKYTYILFCTYIDILLRKYAEPMQTDMFIYTIVCTVRLSNPRPVYDLPL